MSGGPTWGEIRMQRALQERANERAAALARAAVVPLEPSPPPALVIVAELEADPFVRIAAASLADGDRLRLWLEVPAVAERIAAAVSRALEGAS